MASWAGAAGAGAASDALKELVAQQLLARKQAEVERAQKVQEAQNAAEMAQRGDMQRQNLGLQFAELAGRRDDSYQNRTQAVQEMDRQTTRQALADRIRAKERADDSLDKTTDREDQQKNRAEEMRSRQAFERSMMDARSGGPASEPLVAIKDPTTGQPTLVPRSQAAGKSPASTRDQAMTEGQSNAAGFADRMKINESSIKAYESSAAASVGGRLASMLPRDFQSSERQSYDSAKKNWMAAQLRKESGAAISAGEYDEADRQYFPQPGDDAANVKRKRELRAVAEASMRRAAGHGGAPTLGDATAGPLQPGTRRSINGTAAVWDGNGWLAEEQ